MCTCECLEWSRDRAGHVSRGLPRILSAATPHPAQGREQHELDHAAAFSQAQRALRFGEIMRYSLKNGGDGEEEEDDLEVALSDDPLGSDMGELGDGPSCDCKHVVRYAEV